MLKCLLPGLCLTKTHRQACIACTQYLAGTVSAEAKMCRVNTLCLVTQMVKNSPAMQETQVPSLGWEDPLETGMVNLLQHSCPENPMDRGAWWATVLGVAKSHMTEQLTQI